MKSRSFLLVLFLLLTAFPAAAEKLYRYRDPSGQWAFSDRPPSGNVPVQVEQVRRENLPNKIGLLNKGTQGEPFFYLVNEYFGPVEVEILLQSGRNIVCDPPLPARFTIPAAAEIPAVRIRPADRRQGWSYNFSYRFSFGDPAAVHRPASAYRPPLAPGQAYPITQAFHGSFSHREPYSEYAVDIAMPEGTPVHAARAGVVMEIANDFYGAGLDLEKYGSRANFICIAHEDGTLAIYAHLQLEASQVSPGARVTAGQLLGYSGNTGFSGGPHLHFVIQRNAGMKLIAVPFEFADGQGRGIIPEAGEVLRGF